MNTIEPSHIQSQRILSIEERDNITEQQRNHWFLRAITDENKYTTILIKNNKLLLNILNFLKLIKPIDSAIVSYTDTEGDLIYKYE